MQEQFSTGPFALEKLVELKDSFTLPERIKAYLSLKCINLFPALGREILCDLWAMKLEKSSANGPLDNLFFSQFMNMSDVIVINANIHEREVEGLKSRVRFSQNRPYIILMGNNVIGAKKNIEKLGLNIDVLLTGSRPDSKAWKEAFRLLILRMEKGVCANA